MKITFFTRVECKPPVPLCSLMKARILLDAYFTISPSKVAVITHAPTPLETVWEDRNPDPIWVTALKIASYVLLAPFALLALFAKCALYCIPLHTYAPKCDLLGDALCDLVKRGESGDHSDVRDVLVEIVKDEVTITRCLDRLEHTFKSSFPPPGAEEDYSKGSLLTKQQKTYLKNYVAIKAKLIEALVQKGGRKRQSYMPEERKVVYGAACAAWVKLLNSVPSGQDNEPSGYAVLKIYYQDAFECYGVAYTAAGYGAMESAQQAQYEVLGLFVHMATTHLADSHLTFIEENAQKSGETREIITHLKNLRQHRGKEGTGEALRQWLREALSPK